MPFAGRLSALAVGLVGVIAALGCEQGGAPVVNEPVATKVSAPREAPPVVAADDERDIAVTPTGPVAISFDPPKLDFGYVPPGKDMHGEVLVRNDGGEPVKIEWIKPTCKCTTLNDLSGRILGPGESAKLDIVLEGRSVTGTRGAALRVKVEGVPSTLTIDVTAEVTLGIRVNPSVLNMAPPKIGDPITTSGFVTVESVDGSSFNILATDGHPPHFVEFDPDLDEPRNSYLLKWDLSDKEASSDLPRWWVIETDFPGAEIVDAWVRHPRTIRRGPPGRPWSVPDLRVMAGHLEAGQPKDLEIRIKDIVNDEITVARSLSGILDVRLVKFEREGDDAICTIRVTPKAGSSGVVVTEIELLSPSFSHQMDVVGKIGP